MRKSFGNGVIKVRLNIEKLLMVTGTVNLDNITTHHRLHSDKNVTLVYNDVTLKKGASL